MLAFGLITFVGAVPALGGTTALCVFTVVNIAVLVLRSDRVQHTHFRSPTILPVLGALTCAFLTGPWTGRDPVQYKVAGVLIGIGIVLWVVTIFVNRATGLAADEPDVRMGTRGPVNWRRLASNMMRSTSIIGRHNARRRHGALTGVDFK